MPKEIKGNTVTKQVTNRRNEKKEDKVVDSFSNEATSKILGYDYQKLVALEICLNAKKNQTIWIECLGDVANSEISIEVKHHLGDSSITSNSVDVWKTIYNYSKEAALVEQQTQLVLHTTSKVNEDSIFNNWNNLSGKEKYDKISKHNPVATIQEYHNSIQQYNKDDVIKTLSKFQILHSQPNVIAKWNELLEHSAFKLIRESLKESALEKLYGYITKMAIQNTKKWRININDFNDDIVITLSRFTREDIPFPIVEFVPNENDNQSEFTFLQKMKSVNINQTHQANAVKDYIRANMSQIELLKRHPIIQQNLDEYDSNIDRMLIDEKGAHYTDITESDLDTEKAHDNSRKLYFSCIKKSHEQIIGVSNTQKYYKDGRVHHILETSKFEWRYSKYDL